MRYQYRFPDEDTLANYLAMLRQVLVYTRNRTYIPNPEIGRLLDAVENVPDLLCRWPDTDEKMIIDELKAYEAQYCDGASLFSRTITEGHQGEYGIHVEPTGEAS